MTPRRHIANGAYESALPCGGNPPAEKSHEEPAAVRIIFAREHGQVSRKSNVSAEQSQSHSLSGDASPRMPTIGVSTRIHNLDARAINVRQRIPVPH